MNASWPPWQAPTWGCCEVVGAVGDTACWVCGNTNPAAKRIIVYEQGWPLGPGDFPDDQPVDHLTTHHLMEGTNDAACTIR